MLRPARSGHIGPLTYAGCGALRSAVPTSHSSSAASWSGSSSI